MKKTISFARQLYGRFERPISSLSLVGGFVFDAITLKRVDTLWENIWVIGHLVIVAFFMILVNVRNKGEGDESNPEKAHFWYVNILQFFFGGLLSTYLVFYFRSSDILVSWPFILLLALAFWANESLKRQFVRLSFQISLFFLSLFSFSIFLLPVVLHSIGVKIFLLSGLVSLVVMVVFMFIFRTWGREKFQKGKKIIIISITTIYILMNILYFTNIIPPIPLSLKDGDVFHSIYKDGSGNYLVSYEDGGWRDYLALYRDFHVSDDEPVYVYSAVFSPSELNVTIVHEWQYYDVDLKKWVSQGRFELPVVGGRGGGYRTYSMKTNLFAGHWRVNVETEQGQVIGRIRFNIVTTNIPVQKEFKNI